jgi:hypothetical protein
MAGGKQRGMVFDIRGRRRHVVKAVYAILAVLMGASLFLVVGPVNIGSLLGNGSSGSGGTQISVERAENIERKLRKSPEDPALLLSLTRARIAAGTSSQELTSTGEVVPTLETQQQYAKASQAWSEYLKAVDKPTVGAAQQVAPALFRLGEISPSPNEILANFKAAAEAQKIVVQKQPNAGSLSKFALYSMYAGDYAVAEKAGAKVEKLAESKFARERFENQLEEVKKAIKKFKKQLSASKGSPGAAKEGLENPLSGIGASGGAAAE